MKISTFARFMQLNGILSGGRDSMRWLRLPGHRDTSVGNVLGYQHIGRGGLKISSTVVSSSARKRTGAPDASLGTSP
jgi:hypothetical protein